MVKMCQMLFELQQARGEEGGHVESLEVLFLAVPLRREGQLYRLPRQ